MDKLDYITIMYHDYNCNNGCFEPKQNSKQYRPREREP